MADAPVAPAPATLAPAAAPPAAAAAKSRTVVDCVNDVLRQNGKKLTEETNGTKKTYKLDSEELTGFNPEDGLNLEEFNKLGIKVNDEKFFYLVAHGMLVDKTAIEKGDKPDNVISIDDLERFLDHAKKYAQMLGVNPDNPEEMKKVLGMYTSAKGFKVISNEEYAAHQGAVKQLMSSVGQKNIDQVISELSDKFKPIAIAMKTASPNITIETLYKRLFGLAFLKRDWKDEELMRIIKELYGVDGAKASDIPVIEAGVKLDNVEVLKKWLEGKEIKEEAAKESGHDDHEVNINDYFDTGKNSPKQKLTTIVNTINSAAEKGSSCTETDEFIKLLKVIPDANRYAFVKLAKLSLMGIVDVLARLYENEDNVECRTAVATGFISEMAVAANRTGLPEKGGNEKAITTLKDVLNKIKSDSRVTQAKKDNTAQDISDIYVE